MLLRSHSSTASRIAVLALLGLLACWWGWTRHHNFQLALRFGPHPLVLRNLGSSIDLAYTEIGLFPGRIFFHTDEASTSGSHYADTVSSFAGFETAYRPPPHLLLAFIFPMWPLLLLLLYIAIRRPLGPASGFPLDQVTKTSAIR